MSEAARQLRQVADDEVRNAQQQLAGRLRRLADAALEAATALSLADPGERVDLHLVHGRHQSVREASGVLAATKAGAAELRQEADRLRSASEGTGRA